VGLKPASANRTKWHKNKNIHIKPLQVSVAAPLLRRGVGVRKK